MLFRRCFSLSWNDDKRIIFETRMRFGEKKIWDSKRSFAKVRAAERHIPQSARVHGYVLDFATPRRTNSCRKTSSVGSCSCNVTGTNGAVRHLVFCFPSNYRTSLLHLQYFRVLVRTGLVPVSIGDNVCESRAGIPCNGFSAFLKNCSLTSGGGGEG